MCRWGRGSITPPIFSNLQENWAKVNLATREVATVFSITCFCFISNSWWNCQTPTPLTEGVSARHCSLSFDCCYNEGKLVPFMSTYHFVLVVCRHSMTASIPMGLCLSIMHLFSFLGAAFQSPHAAALAFNYENSFDRVVLISFIGIINCLRRPILSALAPVLC